VVMRFAEKTAPSTLTGKARYEYPLTGLPQMIKASSVPRTGGRRMQHGMPSNAAGDSEEVLRGV